MRAKGLILFSGGYDSVALLHRLIVSNDFEKIVVLFENSPNLVGEYETKNAKRIFDKFKNKYSEKYHVELEWISDDINIDWLDKSDKYYSMNKDVCLLLHLMEFMKHGEISNYYLGWHESNIKTLNISKKLLSWFNKYKHPDYNIFFIENYFDGFDEKEVKIRIVKYLLDNNIFDLPYSSGKPETVKEFKERDLWFLNDCKDTEITTALINSRLFPAEDLSKIFTFKTTKEIQKLYNDNKKEN
ncbi:MAG: hypothetical protein ACOCVF_04115 [bacterium]